MFLDLCSSIMACI